MIEKTLASLAMLACVLMLVRLALKPHIRMRLDARMRSAAQRLRERLRERWRERLRRPRRKAQALPDDAAQAAEELIRRASQTGRVDREGNVYRPEKFGKPPKKPH